MTENEIAVTIARIDERLGTLTTNFTELKHEFGIVKTTVQTLHETTIRFGNAIERTRQEMVVKSDCVEHQGMITSMIPCKDGNCAWEVHGKAQAAENRQVRINVKEALLIAAFTVPIILATTFLTNLFHLAK